MNSSDMPKNGDFASYLEGKHARPVDAASPATDQGEPTFDAPAAPRQNIGQVLVAGEQPTQEFLEELKALSEAPPLSDEEIEQQALAAPGADGDPNTPE